MVLPPNPGQRMIRAILVVIFDNRFHDGSHGFQRGRRSGAAAMR